MKTKPIAALACFYRNIWLVSAMTVAISCQEHKPVAGAYYNIDSVLDYQIGFLLKSKAILEKNAAVGADNSHVVFVPADSASWAEELDIFRNLGEINKPVNRGLYKDSVHKDQNSNLTIRSFHALESDLPIEKLAVFYLNKPTDIRRIEATIHEDNLMFSTKRKLRMDFKKRGSQPVISAYSVNGGQKMLLGDSVRYSVAALISIPQN